MTIRSTGSPPTETSKNTVGFFFLVIAKPKQGKQEVKGIIIRVAREKNQNSKH